MKDLISAKIDEIVKNILEKDAHDITYDEYKILDAKFKDMKYEESQKEHLEQMAELMTKTFSYPMKEATIVEREG